jgi:hypothetical protein
MTKAKKGSDMNDKDFLEAYSQEYYLLREIEAHLQMWQNIQRPLKAQDMITTISTEKLVTLMAWAQYGLRERVVSQNRAKETALLAPPPVLKGM